MKREVIREILIFLSLYVICFLYSFFISTVYNDEIWNYGFSYNIASGMIPYKDFGMLQTPLYFMLASVFIKIFGAYLYSFHLFNSLILASIIYILYKKLGEKSLIVIPFVFLNCYPSYNILSLLLVLIIINLVDKDFRYKDKLIGLLVGIVFLTKQNIGICLVIPLIYYSRSKIKSIIGMIVPIVFLVIYLIFNNALYEFFDYAILGMFDFGESNSIWLFFPVEVVICLVILYKLFKSGFKDSRLAYILMYQIVTAPIFDDYHFMLGFILVMYYLLLVKDIKKYKIKYYIIISLFFFLCWNFKVPQFDSLNFYVDRDSYLYGRNIPKYVNLDEISKYINNNKKDYDHIYFFSKNAYYVKLNAKYKLDKFDLILNGNMGYNGSFRYIAEIDNYCSNSRCMFILYKYEFNGKLNQVNKDIIDYVIDNYEIKEEVYWFDIYVN